MLQSGIIFPSHMAGDNIFMFWVSFQDIIDRLLPLAGIGIGQVSKVLTFSTFNKATTIKDFFVVKPDDDVVFGMAFAGIIGFKLMIPHNESGVLNKIVLGLLLVVLFAQIPGLFGCKSFDPIGS